MKKFLFTLLIVGSAVFAADKKISQLPSLSHTSFSTGDEIPIVHSGTTYNTTLGDLDFRYVGISLLPISIANGGTGQTASGAAFNALSPCTSLGGLIYGSAANVNSCLSGNTTSTRKFLNQTGTGSVSAAPGWGTIACGDLTNSVASCSTDTTNASNISSGTIGAARLPNPTPTTLGGVESLAAVSHNWINTISTSGVPSATQPAFTDISGTLDAAQLPNPTPTTLGGIESIAGVSHEWVSSISNSGVPALTQPACSDLSGVAASCATDATNASNISSGTLPAARLPNPTPTTLGGIESIASISHKWVNTISTSGVPSATQPACSDLSGVATSCSTDTTNASNISSGTLAVAEGGTGVNSVTAYAPIMGGTTTTGAFQSATTGMSTSGNCLVSTGASSLPTWQSCAGAGLTVPNRQVFSSTGSTTGYMFVCASCSATAAAVYEMSYTFTTASGSITAGATYTNNSVTFTQSATTVSSLAQIMTGSGNPAASGTLTKTSGTGPATLTFSAFAGQSTAMTTTINTTIASGTFLFGANTSGSVSVAAGSLTKVSGSGDTTITFTTVQPTATYTPTVGTNVAILELQGGGGAGGGGTTFCSAGGGGAGCYGNIKITSPVAGQYTVGAGGSGISNSTGGSGGYTCFNAPTATIYCAGPGLGGVVSALGGNGNGSAGGVGGTCTANFDYSIAGAKGGQGDITATGIEFAGAGAGSGLGVGGQSVNGTQNGNPATGYGSSGGGGSSNNGGAVTGGTGASGIFIAHEFAQ